MSPKLISKIGRKTPQGNIIYVEHTIRLDDGSIPKDLSLIKPLQDTKNIKNGSLHPIDDSYDLVKGIYRQEYKIVESKDPDETMEYKLDGFYTSSQFSEPLQFIDTFYLSVPEQAPVIIVIGIKAEDDLFIATFGVRRSNGKFPAKVDVDSFATRYTGLVNGKIFNKEYSSVTGELKLSYKITPGNKSVDISLETNVSVGIDIPKSAASFSGSVDVARVVTYKVLGKTLSGNTMSVVLSVRWKDNGKVPETFSLKSPFSVGTNVPTGIVDPKSVTYDPKTGVYAFAIKVNTRTEGLLNYTFTTKAIVVGYPDSDFVVSFDYIHQNTYAPELVKIDIRGGRMYSTWNIVKKGEPGYHLEYFSNPTPPFLNIGGLGDNRPRVNWIPNSSQFIMDWGVEIDPVKEQVYDFRGEFLANGVTFPWVIKLTVPTASVTNEKLVRLNEVTMAYSFELVSTAKLKDIFTGDIHIWIDGIPTTTRIHQDSLVGNKVSAQFNYSRPTEKSVDIKVVGSVGVDSGYYRTVPIEFGVTEYLVIPSDSTVNLRTVSHTVSGNKETLLLTGTFGNGNPIKRFTLYNDVVNLNGVDVKPDSATFEDNLLKIVVPVSQTGKLQTFKLSGNVALPDYGLALVTEFSDTLVIGSDTFPSTFTTPRVLITGNSIDIQSGVYLKNGEPAAKVTIGSISDPVNILVTGKEDLISHYDSISGLLVISAQAVPLSSNEMKYELDLVLNVDDGVEVQELHVKVSHLTPPLTIPEIELVSYTVRGGTASFTHRLSTNVGLPKIVYPVVTTARLVGCGGLRNINYDGRTGLITYDVDLHYVSRGLDLSCSFDVRLGNTLITGNLRTGKLVYSPAGKATYLSHSYTTLDNGKQTLTYSWLFRDSVNQIPTLIRPAGKWVNNIGLFCSELELVYNKNTGVGSVTVGVDRDETLTQSFFARTKFKFPSPDVNEYPLEIDFKEEAMRSKPNVLKARRISAPKFNTEGTEVEVTYAVSITSGVFTSPPELGGNIVDLEGNLILANELPVSAVGDLLGSFTVVMNIDKTNSEYPFVKFRLPIKAMNAENTLIVEEQFTTPVDGIQFAGIELLPKTTIVRFRWASDSSTLFKPTSPFETNKNVLVNSGRFLRNIDAGYWYIDLHSSLDPKRDMIYSISTKEGISGEGTIQGTEKKFLTMVASPSRTILSIDKKSMIVEYKVNIVGGGSPTELTYELVGVVGNYNEDVEPVVGYNSASGILSVTYVVDPYMEKHLYTEAIVSLYDPFVINKLSVLMIGKTS